jgi:hypothetical protein
MQGERGKQREVNLTRGPAGVALFYKDLETKRASTSIGRGDIP